MSCNPRNGLLSFGKVATALVAAAIVSVACSSDPEPTSSGGKSPAGEKMTPVLVSSELVVGDNRVVLGLLDENDAPAADPGIEMVVAPLGPDGEPGGGIRTEFVWSLKPVVGVYVTNMTFPSAGTFEAMVLVRGENVEQTTPLSLDVAREGTTPPLSGAAPSVDTPTADTPAEIERISTDNDPDPRFYEYSIADALKERTPFVIVFATPKFCTSQVCGPTLDTVKEVSREFKDVNFIHVEPYELPVDPSKPEIVPAGEAWGLPSEPYVFVVDAKGRVGAKYEGVVGAEELTEQLRELTRR